MHHEVRGVKFLPVSRRVDEQVVLVLAVLTQALEDDFIEVEDGQSIEAQRRLYSRLVRTADLIVCDPHDGQLLFDLYNV